MVGLRLLGVRESASRNRKGQSKIFKIQNIQNIQKI